MIYNTNFDIRKAKYYVVLKESYWKYKDDIFSLENSVYIDREYGIYTYSFEDMMVFLEKELIKYFCKNNLNKLCAYDRKNKLYEFYKEFRIFDLRKKVNIGDEYLDRKCYHDTFSDLKLHKTFRSYTYSESTECYLSRTYELIKKVAEWNNKPYDLKFLHPVIMVDEEYPHWGNKYRPRFHTRDECYKRGLRVHKSEVIAGTDPEYSCYLTARQKNRESSQNFGAPWKKNRFQIPGDWKHYHKCRKQWAKKIKNPSYEKLSKAVWNQELNEVEAV